MKYILQLTNTLGGDIDPEDDESQEQDQEAGETSPLIQQEPSSATTPRGVSTATHNRHGTSARKAFLMVSHPNFIQVLKAFVGTGVLFLPNAFSMGGLGFSIITLIFLGWMTLHCMLLLVQTSRQMNGMSFGELGEEFYGMNLSRALI